jgi:small GTP-binding protein
MTYSIVVLGLGGVGKTCLVLRFVCNRWETAYNPTIQDCFDKRIEVGNESYKLQIIDTAGQDKMGVITNVAIQKAPTYIIVYSVTSMHSFTEAKHFREKIASICRVERPPRIVLAGNKCDAADRAVSRKAGEALAKE